MTMPALQVAKKQLRSRMGDVLQRIPADSITQQSRAATSKLLSMEEYRNARRIGVYLSMLTGELSTTDIVQDALAAGKEVYVPHIHTLMPPMVQAKTSTMDMLSLDSMEEFYALKRDKWGIPSFTKPQAETKKNCFGGTGIAVEARQDEVGLDLLVMPGMAFDSGFRRLGHGRGYYDQFLARYLKDAESQNKTQKMPLLVAPCLREQMLSAPEQVPVADHDWLVDVLIVGDEECTFRQR
ncbi:5-formyltetrahydrofolate cyclo-ligase [Aspergillus steynii IBT 23096]|uniref:5-formyltetrahydrofolate cyclo-ligase n=1 Tax=Aspergillus steynii IBT 23096 TaxID=1392250 RepID=A0A2I2FZZ2_9EURO|nr:5-formyltetrahydrofolate cyclo-ligase [Aspergillus steynii IBT 23096]PLB46146.1 5-formyltetrahydrofolate cyclo-ligase [Aspergillus steynii IBT 23096]